MSAATPNSERLPPSTLDVLMSMLTAEAGAGADTARRWAGEVLRGGVSSEALVELALLQDHEGDKAGALLPRALGDAGIEAEPPERLHALFYRLILRAYTDGGMAVRDLSFVLEGCLAHQPGTAGIGEDARHDLWCVLHAAETHLATRSAADAGMVPVEESEVVAAARTAFARLGA